MFFVKKTIGPKIYKMFEHIDYSQIARKNTLLKVDVSKFICPRSHFGQNGYGVKNGGGAGVLMFLVKKVVFESQFEFKNWT
jgi:hypothetical protein